MAECWSADAVRWVSPENLHLTLRFLGDTAGEQLPGLAVGLDALGLRHRPFTLSVAGIGCFPNLRRPRVIWAGLQDAQERLGPLQQEVEEMVKGVGWPAESRSFRPHLTLGRVRDGKSRGHQPLVDSWTSDPPEKPFEVGSLELIESVLRPGGARYTTLHRSALGGT